MTMPHPELADWPSPPSAGETFRVMQAGSGETGHFYSTARAFYDFLVDRTKSTAVVADLAAAFRRGEKLENWILARTAHAQSRGGLDGLNADFLKGPQLTGAMPKRSDRRPGRVTAPPETTSTKQPRCRFIAATATITIEPLTTTRSPSALFTPAALDDAYDQFGTAR